MGWSGQEVGLLSATRCLQVWYHLFTNIYAVYMSDERCTFAWRGRCWSCILARSWSCVFPQPARRSSCTVKGRAPPRSCLRQTRRTELHDFHRSCSLKVLQRRVWKKNHRRIRNCCLLLVPVFFFFFYIFIRIWIPHCICGSIDNLSHTVYARKWDKHVQSTRWSVNIIHAFNDSSFYSAACLQIDSPISIALFNRFKLVRLLDECERNWFIIFSLSLTEENSLVLDARGFGVTMAPHSRPTRGLIRWEGWGWIDAEAADITEKHVNIKSSDTL